MSRTKPRIGTTVVSPTVAAKVAAVAARVGFTREQALAIAAAEPRGATIFAGSVKLQPSRRQPTIATVRAKRASKSPVRTKALVTTG